MALIEKKQLLLYDFIHQICLQKRLQFNLDQFSEVIPTEFSEI